MTETDLIIKNDELLINGYTVSPDTGDYILNAFRQEPQNISIAEILPHNVSMILHLGLENFDSCVSYLSQWGDQKNDLKDFAVSTKKNYGVDIYKHFIAWIGTEVAIAGIDTDTEITILQTNDIKVASASLTDMAYSVNNRLKSQAFAEEFGEYVIGQINIPGLLPHILGPAFSSIKENYFITIKDYVVFANSPEVLKSLVNDFYNRKTLAENQNYQSFSNNISDKSNIYFYCNIRRSLNCITKTFHPGIADLIIKNRKILQNFEGLAIQFSYINEMFYTNIYLKHNPGHTEVNPSNWETELESAIWGQPYFVKNHITGQLNIIATDELANMYLLNHLGQIKWKIPLIEKPQSPIFEVDYFKNNQIQFLFNTENYIYLVDIDGNYVGEYPVKLVTPATNSIAVFDYGEIKSTGCCLPIPTTGFTITTFMPVLVDGWKKIQAKATVRRPVEHFVQEDKDYLFIRDEKGNVAITNRRGEDRIELRKNFEMGKTQKSTSTKPTAKGILLPRIQEATLFTFQNRGRLTGLNLIAFRRNTFSFTRTSRAITPLISFILMMANLSCLIVLRKSYCRNNLPKKQQFLPFHSEAATDLHIGIVNQTGNDITFYDRRGKVNSYPAMQGQTPFIIGNFNKEEDTYLIIGSENKIKCYSLE
ncbi:MAG: DUF3352 domain-containing protein [Bacteroidales bacterium]